MRISARPLALFAGVVSLAALSAHCGSDAVGIDACHRIEDKRCEVAPACGAEFVDVDACKDFYRDQCLAGIENAEHSPTESEVKACEAAIGAAADCAKAGKKTIGECAGAQVVAAADPKKTPCQMVTQTTHQLAACAFLAAAPADAGATATTTTTTTATGGGGGAGGGGGGAPQ